MMYVTKYKTSISVHIQQQFVKPSVTSLYILGYINKLIVYNFSSASRPYSSPPEPYILSSCSPTFFL